MLIKVEHYFSKIRIILVVFRNFACLSWSNYLEEFIQLEKAGFNNEEGNFTISYFINFDITI